jgi:hypothetical protein
MAPRELIFSRAAARGIHAISAGPFGFSCVWIVFDPKGMSFHRYFDLARAKDAEEKFSSFVIGMAPKGTQMSYTDISHVDVTAHTGPSLALACELASGVMGAEVLKILLGRGRVFSAPYVQQFDPYVGKLVRTRTPWGNRHPLRRLKRWLLVRYLRSRRLRIPAEF